MNTGTWSRAGRVAVGLVGVVLAVGGVGGVSAVGFARERVEVAAAPHLTDADAIAALGAVALESTVRLDKLQFRGEDLPDAFGTVPDVVSGRTRELEIRMNHQLFVAEPPISPPVQEVALTTSNAQAFPVPASVKVFSNEIGSPGPFIVRAGVVQQPTPVEITATFKGITKKLNFKVLPAAAGQEGAELFGDVPDRPNRYSVLRGHSSSFPVRMDRPAPEGGQKVRLSLSNDGLDSGVSVSGTVTIPAGQRFAMGTFESESDVSVDDDGQQAIIEAKFDGAPNSNKVVVAKFNVCRRLKIMHVYRDSFDLYPYPPGQREMVVEFNASAIAGQKIDLKSPSSKIDTPDFDIPTGSLIVRVPFSIDAGTPPGDYDVSLELKGPHVNGSKWEDDVDVQAPALRTLELGVGGVEFMRSAGGAIVGGTGIGRLTLTGLAGAPTTFTIITAGGPAGTSIPTSVTIPTGQDHADFPITVAPSAGSAGYDLSMRVESAAGVRKDFSWPVRRQTITELGVVEHRIKGGESCTLRLKLLGPAGSGGQQVRFTSSTPFLKPPSTFTIPEGERQVFIPVPSEAISIHGSQTINAYIGNLTGSPTMTANVIMGPTIRIPTAGGYVELMSGRVMAGGSIEGRYVRDGSGPVGWPVIADVEVYESEIITLVREAPGIAVDIPMKRPGGRVGPGAKLPMLAQPKSELALAVASPDGQGAFKVQAPKLLLHGGLAGIKVSDRLAPPTAGGIPITNPYEDVFIHVIGSRDITIDSPGPPRLPQYVEWLRMEGAPARAKIAETLDELERVREGLLPGPGARGKKTPSGPRPRPGSGGGTGSGQKPGPGPR